MKSNHHQSAMTVIALAAILSSAPTLGADMFKVTQDPAMNGSYQVSPAPSDGKYPAGTVLTVTTKPDAGFVFDSGYFSTPGRWGAMFYESMTPTFKVTVDKDMSIGASFVEKSAVDHVEVRQDI